MRPPSESDCVVCFVGTSDNTGHFANTTSRNNSRSEKYYQRKRFRHKLIYRDKRPQGGRMVMIFSSIVRLFRTIFIVLKQLLTLSKTKVVEYQAVRYCDCPLSPSTEARLLSVVPVRRKVMVLDLDETLIHSHHDNFNNSSPPLVMKGIPDFCVQVYIENHPVQFYVYKRPHLDFFLTMICQWYDLVIFTASMQKYGMEVANHLDQNRGILPRRYFRQDCTMDMNGYTKDLTMVCEDLSNIFILDNSPSAYRGNPDNAIPIKSWFSDPTDTALLDLLPFLDCLRFTHDVRSVLSRNLHQHSLWERPLPFRCDRPLYALRDEFDSRNFTMNEEGAGNHSNLLSLLSKSSKIVNDHGYAEMTVNLSDDNTMIKRVWPRTTFPSQMHRWNIPEEVLSYLISYTSHTQWTTHHVPIKPCSGTMLLYNKTKTKYYKGDGHDWKTRNSSTKTVREDRTKLKVCGHTLLYGCYTRSESNPQFHRRCYWLIKNPSLVLVHYLDTSNSSRTATVATMKKVTDQEVTIFEETSVSDISLIAVSDQDLCQYLSRTAVSICSSLQTLSEQVLLISNELHRDATLTDFITVIKQRIYLEEKSVTQKPSQSLQSLPPHVLLINQAIHLLQLQAQSCQYGNQSLLPKGISTLSPSLLLKAASYLMHNSQQSNEEEEPHPSPSVSTPTSQLPNIDADFTQPLQPVSIETLKAVLPGELDPEPSSTDYKDNDFNMADFTKFAHSLITMNPLKDAEHLMHSSSQNQVLETSSTSSQNADNISDTFFQQFFQELTMVPPTSSTHHQMSLDPQPEFNADNYLQVPPLSNADHTYFNPPTSPIDYSLLEGLDPDSLKVLLELSNNDGGLVEGESLSPVSQYMASLRDEVDDHVALEDESCDNHMIIDDQVNDTIGPGWNTSVQQQGTSITMATHNLLDEGSFDTTLLPESHDLSSDPPLGSGDLQFANSLLQHHVSDQPTDLSLSHTPSPLPYAQIPESSSGYHTSSPFQSPSSPSLASVSSLSTAGGDSYFDEPPLVAELCELLSESPNVQHTDFSHLSLSDSEQQELLEASRVIQNTLRRCKERPNPLVTLKEKHAALLIERSYKQYREIKRKKDEAARCIQHQYRLYRRRTIELQRAALFIQQMYRYQRRKRTNITMTTTSSPHSSMTSSSYNMYRYNSH